MRSPAILTILLCLGSFSLVQRAAAQGDETAKPAQKQYAERPIDEDVKKNRFKVNRILLAGRFANPAEKKLLDSYYEDYALARWSLIDNRHRLPEFRKELTNNLRTCGTGGRPAEVHGSLNALALRYMGELAVGDFHPATRVNAMLMIGELNQRESTSPAAPPAPLPTALPELVKAVEADDQVDTVKLAALVGIIRHGELGAITADADRNAVVGAMLALLNAKRPPERSVDGDGWIRARAVELLGILQVPASNAAVSDMIRKMMADRTLPFSARRAAADALGKLNYQGFGAASIAPLAAALSQLTTDACAAEKESPSRRQLKSRLSAVDGALTPLAGIAGAPEIVGRLKTLVTAMLGFIENRKLQPEAMMGKINQEIGKFNPTKEADQP